MTIVRIEFGTPEFDEAVHLRYTVLRAPLGLNYNADQLAEEYAQVHLAAFSDTDELIGYLNLTPADEADVKMRQVAVDPRWQGRGVGGALVQASERLAQSLGFQKMVLHARETAVSFYLSLGYSVIGERFEEVTIPHFRMEKSLAA